MSPVLQPIDCEPFTPKQETTSYLILEGPYTRPVPYRQLPTFGQQGRAPVRLGLYEIIVLAKLSRGVKRIALNVQQLALELHLTPLQFQKAAKKPGGFRVEYLVKKQQKLAQCLLETTLEKQDFLYVKQVVYTLVRETFFREARFLKVTLRRIARNKITFIVASDAFNKVHILFKKALLGKGAVSRVSKWFNSTDVRMEAVKQVLVSTNEKSIFKVRQEAELLECIAAFVKEKSIEPIGLPLPLYFKGELASLSIQNGCYSSVKKSSYFFTRPVYGTDLLQHFFQLTPLNKKQIAFQCAVGLKILHEDLKRAHGDIKLENILLGPTGETFHLNDFGDGMTLQAREEECRLFFLTENCMQKMDDFMSKINGSYTILHPYDRKALITSSYERNMRQFHAIKQANDIYAFGLVIFLLMSPRFAVQLLSEHDHCVDWQDESVYVAIQRALRPDSSFVQEVKSLLDPSQIVMVERMLDPCWIKRPCAGEVLSVFPRPSSQ